MRYPAAIDIGGLVRTSAPVLKALELAIFGGYPPKNSYPPDQGLTFGESCPAPVTFLVAVLRPVAFYFRKPAQLRFPVPSSSLRAPCGCAAGYFVSLGIACSYFLVASSSSLFIGLGVSVSS